MTNSEAYRNIVFRNIGMIKNVCLGILQVEKDIEGARNVLSAMAELLTGDIQSMIPDYTGTNTTSDKSSFDEITEFMEEDNK